MRAFGGAGIHDIIGRSEDRGGMTSPYGSQLGIWYPVSCTFDEKSLRQRLSLNPAIKFEEYDGRVAGSDATFYCPMCKCAIMGLRPRYAAEGTVRVG